MSTVYETITSMTSAFTPAPECFSQWTYEAQAYNGMPGGMLAQNLYQQEDFLYSCYPPGLIFSTIEVVHPATIQIYDPGTCPVGYTAGYKYTITGATNAICCMSGFSVPYPTVASYTPFTGCISTWSGTTTVLNRIGDIDDPVTSLEYVILEGQVTMWAMPVYIRWQEKDLSLYLNTATHPNTALAGHLPAKEVSTVPISPGAPTITVTSADMTSTTSIPFVSGTGSLSPTTSSLQIPTTISTSTSTSLTSLTPPSSTQRRVAELPGSAIAGLCVGIAVLGLLVMIMAVISVVKQKDKEPTKPSKPRTAVTRVKPRNTARIPDLEGVSWLSDGFKYQNKPL